MAGDEVICKQGCGRVLTSEGRRLQHELHCQGKPATSRIAGGSGAHVKEPEPVEHESTRRTPPAAKKPRTKRSSPVLRKKRKSKRAGLPARKAARRSPRQASPYAGAIAALKAKLATKVGEADRIAKALDALENLEANG